MSNPVHSAAERIATGATFGGSGGAVFFGLTANELAAWVGVAIALGGLLMNWHFNRKRDKREQQQHEARMKGSGK